MAALMIFTGLLVASMRIDQGLSAPDPDEFTMFWKHFGLLIFYSLVLFAGFYAAAIANRGRPEIHKRMMIVASASALPAAVFRIIVGLSGFYWLQTPDWVMPAAFFLPCIFILIGILYDVVAFRAAHRVYLIGLPIVVGPGIFFLLQQEGPARTATILARLADLLRANPSIRNPSLIYPGQQIQIPEGGSVPATSGPQLFRARVDVHGDGVSQWPIVISGTSIDVGIR